MADVGLGQTITSTARYRHKKALDAMKDSHPVTAAMKKHGGWRSIPGGRSIVEESLSDQNDTVSWVGRNGTVSLAENNVIDSAEETMSYMLGAVVISRAEQLENRGEHRYVPLVASKLEVLENTQANLLHEGILSAGTGSGGLQMGGLAEKVPSDPTTGTVMGIDRSSADAAWFRSQKFNTASDWSDGSVDSGNVTRFLDKGLNATTSGSMLGADLGLLGQTHWEALSSAVRAVQQIVSDSETAKIGHNKIFYRTVPMYFSGGINYSGYSTQSVDKTYLLCTKRGGFNLVFMDGGEFEMLDKVDAADQASISRLMFTMVCTVIGAYAKRCWVGYDS